jgi:putative addiction module killer protein
MRIHVGPGYRLYYCRRGEVIYLLLCGGDKSSQPKDIRKAKTLLKSLEN